MEVLEPRVRALEQPDGHGDDVVPLGVDVVERPVEVRERVVVAHRARARCPAAPRPRPGRGRWRAAAGTGRGRRPRACAAACGVVPLGDDEDDVEDGREGHAPDRGQLLGEQVDDRDREQRDGDQRQADREFDAADPQVERHPPLARAGLLVAQHEHREALEREAPDDAERVRLAQQVDVAAAER